MSRDELILDKSYQLLDGFVMRKINEETTMAYSKTSGDLYEFDDITEDILCRMKDGKSLREIYNELCELYDAGENEILEDYVALINRLIECKVIILL